MLSLQSGKDIKSTQLLAKGKEATVINLLFAADKAENLHFVGNGVDCRLQVQGYSLVGPISPDMGSSTRKH